MDATMHATLGERESRWDRTHRVQLRSREPVTLRSPKSAPANLSLQTVNTLNSRTKSSSPAPATLLLDANTNRPKTEYGRRALLYRQRWHQERTPSAGCCSRLLGADIYPMLNCSDIRREKTFFRSSVDALSKLLSVNSRLSFDRWNNLVPRDATPGDASFCRAVRVETLTNNADFAKIFRAVPERVVSESDQYGSYGIALPLESQPVCRRRNDFSHYGLGDASELAERVMPDSPQKESCLAVRLACGTTEHSAEWLRESRNKQALSITILSEQLKSLIEQPTDLLSPQSSSHSLISACNNVDKASSGSVKAGVQNESTSCMKTMQCEVLGPDLCTDCTRIRKSHRQQQEQRSLYPGLETHPRSLVAPQRIRRLNASLPPAFTSQKQVLNCGCAINLHRDFLFPAIITDHDIHSRLCAAPAGQCGERCNSHEPQFALQTSDTKKASRADVLTIKHSGDTNETSANPTTDIKVTVRYAMPSPEPDDTFLT